MSPAENLAKLREILALAPRRVRVILSSVVTWAGVAIVVLTFARSAVVDLVAETGIDHPAVDIGLGWIGYAIAVLVAIVGALRNVTPVEDDERGVLPPPPVPPTSAPGA